MARGEIKGLVKKVETKGENLTLLTFLPEKLDGSKVDKAFFETFQEAEVKVPFYNAVVPRELSDKRVTLKIIVEDGGIDLSVMTDSLWYQTTLSYERALEIDSRYGLRSIF